MGKRFTALINNALNGFIKHLFIVGKTYLFQTRIGGY